MIRIEVILPKNMSFLDPATYTRVIDRALDMRAEDIRIDFRVVTQTWSEGVKPKFVIQAPKELVRIIGTDSKIFKFVSGGTRIRYATMTRDFVAKTIPDYIGSGPGAGGVAFISKKHPRPGIKARNFDQRIAEKWEKRFPALMAQSLRVEAAAAIRRAGGTP